MKFIDYLYDADGCMCDVLYNYDDIHLQALFPLPNSALANGSLAATYSYKIDAYDLAGNLIASDLGNDFDKFTYKVQNQNLAYSNIVSKRISEALCDVKCFRLKVDIKSTIVSNGLQFTTLVFSSFTDCMKVDNCCVKIPVDGVLFDTIIGEPIGEIEFYVDDDMNLIYKNQGDKKFDFKIQNNDLVVSGDSGRIAAADFKIVSNEIFGKSYE